MQEALLAAADHWPREGVPDAPYGWLLRTAQRRLIDQRRSERSRADREVVAQQRDPAGEQPPSTSRPPSSTTTPSSCCSCAVIPR